MNFLMPLLQLKWSTGSWSAELTGEMRACVSVKAFSLPMKAPPEWLQEGWDRELKHACSQECGCLNAFLLFLPLHCSDRDLEDSRCGKALPWLASPDFPGSSVLPLS